MDKSRVAELKSALAKRVDEINEGITQGVKVDGANVEVSQDTANKVRDLMSEATQIKSLIDAEEFGTETKSWLNEPERQSMAMDASTMATLRFMSVYSS